MAAMRREIPYSFITFWKRLCPAWFRFGIKKDA
jgi:hypothetical protein